MLPYFTFFNNTIYNYGFLWVLGFIAGGIYLLIINYKGTAGKLSWIDLILIYVFVIIAVYNGGKLLGFLYNLIFESSSQPNTFSLQYLKSLYGRNLLYGSVVAAFAIMFLYSKIFKISFKKIIGIFIPFGALFIGFARLGCLFAGCCYGIPSRFGYVFNHLNSYAPIGIRLFPTQLIESIFGFVLFIIFLILQKRWKEEKSYLTLPIFIVSYCTLSFLLDFVRGDTLVSFLFLTVSQWSSVIGVAIVVIWWIVYKKHKKTFNAT